MVIKFVPLVVITSIVVTNCWADEVKTTNWLLRARLIDVVPDVSSSTITKIGGNVTRISSQIEPEVDISYFFKPQFAIEIPAATMRSSVRATGTVLGPINLGQVSVLPPMILFQYHPQFNEKIKPYAGVGPNYTIFYHSNSGPVANKVTYSDNWGVAFQLGTDLIIDKHWSINVDFKKILVKTHATVYALGTSVSSDVNINPMIYGVGVGYHF